MYEVDQFRWEDVNPEQIEVLNENWAGAQDMLAHLLTLHSVNAVPHPAVMGAEEMMQYQMLDAQQAMMVLRAAVVALYGASSFIEETIGADGLKAMMAAVEKAKDAE